MKLEALEHLALWNRLCMPWNALHFASRRTRALLARHACPQATLRSLAEPCCGFLTHCDRNSGITLCILSRVNSSHWKEPTNIAKLCRSKINFVQRYIFANFSCS